MTPSRALLAFAFAVIPAACTQDFDQFAAGGEAGAVDPAALQDGSAATPDGQSAADGSVVDGGTDAGSDASKDVATDHWSGCTPDPACLGTATSCGVTCHDAWQTCRSQCGNGNSSTDRSCRGACYGTQHACTDACKTTCTDCTTTAGCTSPWSCSTAVTP